RAVAAGLGGRERARPGGGDAGARGALRWSLGAGTAMIAAAGRSVDATMPGFCRDCRRDAPDGAGRCAGCGSPRLLRHAEIETLAIAHVDCDAFYATIEK